MMAPQKYSAQVMNCKANGAVYPSSDVSSIKKPKMEQLQADHELFLQAFESESISLKLTHHSKTIICIFWPLGKYINTHICSLVCYYCH